MVSSFDDLIEEILVNYRWAFVCLFLLPISFVYNFFYYIRNKIVFALSSAPKKHDSKVKKIQKQVTESRETKRFQKKYI